MNVVAIGGNVGNMTEEEDIWSEARRISTPKAGELISGLNVLQEQDTVIAGRRYWDWKGGGGGGRVLRQSHQATRVVSWFLG